MFVLNFARTAAIFKVPNRGAGLESMHGEILEAYQLQIFLK